MSNFPTSLPSFTVTSGSETANGAAGGIGLSGLLNSFEDEITAIATKLGIGSATPANHKVLVGNGTGTSTWSTTLAGLTLSSPTINSATLTSPVADADPTEDLGLATKQYVDSICSKSWLLAQIFS